MIDQHLNRGFALCHLRRGSRRVGRRGKGSAEEHFCTAVVHVRVEREVSRTCRRPASQNARELRDVCLRVASVHTKRVELHDLARVVLIRSWRLTTVLVEVDQHRTTL